MGLRNADGRLRARYAASVPIANATSTPVHPRDCFRLPLHGLCFRFQPFVSIFFSMPYFVDNYEHLRYPIESDDHPGFRKAQLGAIYAVGGHFAQRSDPAIVTMPTGSGKTAVMIVVTFILRARRVLVVTPSRLVREQISDEISSMSLLVRLGALPHDVEKPKVRSVGEKVVTPDQWRELREYDVVVGTVQSTSPALNDIATPEPDQYDVVIVDEAHHSPAVTWQALLDCFPSSKRVLFTATPFRRDRREIRGRFVFTYDLQAARNDGVFGRIQYRAVEGRGDERSHDIAVAIDTQDQLRADQDAGLDHLVMVRTDRKTRARDLTAIYKQHTDLRLALLHSDHSLRHAKSVIRRLCTGELDGIITVNMLGEGFDLPRLKIAAVHAPHKSLSATLQFIGRFARTVGDNIGTATFLAIPDDIEIERRRLFEAGASWQILVENLSAEQMDKEVQVREVIESFDQQESPAADLTDLSIYALEPYHHVMIYRTSGEVDLSADIDLSGRANVAYRSISHDHATAIWITRERSATRWSRDGSIVDVSHELIVMHFHSACRLLFICSTVRTQAVYEMLGRCVMDGAPRILPLARINRALNGLSGLEFFNVGMRNRVQGNQTESYRIITGPSAGEAILPSDARLFHRGHCFGRGETGDGPVTIGLSSSSKVWSNKSSRVPDLIAWCEELAVRIEADRIPITGGGLDNLSPGEEVDSLPSGIFRADWDYHLYRYPRMVDIRGAGRDRTIQLLDIEVKVESDRCTESAIALAFQHDEDCYRATFSFDADRLFEPVNSNEIEMYVISGNESTPLIQQLNEHPLCFYTEDLSLLRGFDLHRPPVAGGRLLSEDQIQTINWEDEGVDIRSEFGSGENGLRSIHQFIEERLSASRAKVVYYDHGSGEVADFVAFEGREGHVTVSLYHCKRSGGDVPGRRLEDVYEVCGQAVKSVVYADPMNLVERIEDRFGRSAGASRFVKGSCGSMRRLVQTYNRSEFDFEMIIV